MPQTSRQHSSNQKEIQLSEDVKFLLIVLLLFVFYPVGLILMWAWAPWPTWVKLLVSLPVLIVIFFLFMAAIFFAVVIHNGRSQWQWAPPMREYYYRGEYVHPMMNSQQLPPMTTPATTESY